MNYLIKVEFDTGEVSKSGKAISIKSQYIVEDEHPITATEKLAEELKNSQYHWHITSISETKIEKFIS